MPGINESRRVKIRDRRITLQDVQKLSQFVVNEYEELKAKCDYVRLSFSAICDDMSTFESEDQYIFDNSSIITTKSVKRIEINCLSLRPDNTLKISIAHGNNLGLYDSEIVVSGSDSKWINGTLRRMEEIIDSFTPQHNLIKEYWIPIFTVCAISLGSIMIHVFLAITPDVPPSAGNEKSNFLISITKAYPFMRYPIMYFFYFVFGLFPAGALIEKLSKLWPSVELQIGPEHTLIEKQRRRWVTGGITLGGIPMLVQLVYDILKPFVSK